MNLGNTLHSNRYRLDAIESVDSGHDTIYENFPVVEKVTLRKK